MSRFVFIQSTQEKFSYLENKEEVKNLEEAFRSIEIITSNQRLPLDSVLLPLADSDYELFLDKNNPYHVLLSYKIHVKIESDSENSKNNKIEQDLRTFEKRYSLKYENEIEKILKSSEFNLHMEEELFLIEELTLFKPEEVINLIESKLNRSINQLNKNDDLDDAYFESLLSIYLKKIRLSEIDEVERRTLLEQEIKSPRLARILDAHWAK